VKCPRNPREVAGVQSGGPGRVSGGVPRGRPAGEKMGTGPQRYKHWIPNRTKRKLTLGEDIGLEDTVSLALLTLVGRFSYMNRCKMSLDEWVSVTGVRCWAISQKWFI
jgi:hypothetical protein